MMNALVVGGSGLVGTALLRQLSENPAFDGVVAAVRSPLQNDTVDAGKSREYVSGDLFADSMPSDFSPDVVFCCLGTTIKKAGSQAAFRRIDFELPLCVARAALQRGAKHFVVVSSIGANSKSRVFYNRVKGEMEEALKQLGYSSICIVRPSLLLGEREEQRFGEQVGSLIMQSFSFLIPKKWKPVQASTVAESMIRCAVNNQSGVCVVENQEMFSK